MQLTKAEVDAAHLIVTTPEKWDVITRKVMKTTTMTRMMMVMMIAF
jgi:replicative superfamily II helicase